MMKENLHPNYLETLLLYFEEEIMGEAYFYGLAEKFPQTHQREKMKCMAEVERFAAEAVRSLLNKYELQPRDDVELYRIGALNIDKSLSMGWEAFITDMVERYPNYMPQFRALEAMAPKEDRPALEVMTEHEIAAIEFANLEIAGDEDSAAPLRRYLVPATV